MWHGRMRHGFGQYFMGSSLFFMLASAVNRVFKRPYVLGSIGMVIGFLLAMIRRVPRYPDLDFRSFLRSYQRSCLLHGKARAMQAIEDAQAEVWNPSENGQSQGSRGRE